MTRAHHHALLITLVALASCSDAAGPTPEPDRANLSLGGHFGCQIRTSALLCWGRGVEGQLGIGVAPPDSVPTAVAGAPPVTAIVGGSTHACGLEGDGDAWCWGSNGLGELGTTVTNQQCGGLPCQMSPVPAAPGLRFRALAAGSNFTCGLATDGRVHCWGLNDTGQLGNPNTGMGCGGLRCSATPVVAAGGKKFSAIAAGRSHICALTSDGVAFCWGYEALPIPGGHPNPTFLPNPRKVTGAPPFARISAGGYHTCAITGSDEAWCWGIDAIGAGPSKLESATPVRVIGGHRFIEIAAGRVTSCGLERSGIAYCWGPNGNGEIGNLPVGSTIRFDTPVPISSSLRFEDLSAGGHTYCGLTTGGQTVCWGQGSEGELGSGHEDSTIPVVVIPPASPPGGA